MSDADRLEAAVTRSLLAFVPHLPPDHFVTLTYLVVGLILGRNVQLSKIAEQVNYDYKESSLEARFGRFVDNEHIVVKLTYTIFVKLIFAGLDAKEPLVFSIDTTKTGAACVTLMISVGYGSRALPVCWLTFKGRKGHTSQAVQLTLLEALKAIVPDDYAVILLGDGEFDGAQVIEWLQDQSGWRYVCRSDETTKIYHQETWLALKDLPLKSGREAFFTHLPFTQAHQVGPLNILVIWHHTEKRHWFFVTNFDTRNEAKQWYRKRFQIETLFADFKGRGFNFDQCRLKEPARVNRLLMAVSIAYLFVVFWGVQAISTGDFALMVRTDRFDHSLFTLGLKYIQRLLKKVLPISLLLSWPPPSSFNHYVV